MKNGIIPESNGGHDADPGDLEPASTATKEQILGFLEQKTEGGHYSRYGSIDWREITLFSRQANNIAYDLIFIPEEYRLPGNAPIDLGRVVKVVVMGSKHETVQYNLTQTPDRTIDIEKKMSMSDVGEQVARSRRLEVTIRQGDHVTAHSMAEENLRNTEDAIEAEKQYAQLGLGFVPEKEALALLNELTEAVPDRPQ